MEPQDTDNQNNTEQKDCYSDILLPEVDYRAIVIETMWHLHRNRQVDQGNKTENQR